MLTEIGELQVILQSQLLTFLETRSLLPIGGLKNVHVNVRIIASTYHDLNLEIAGDDS